MGIDKMVESTITLVVALIVIFSIVGGTAATIIVAAGNISGSGLPLAALFGGAGVVLIIFMSSLLLRLMRMAFKK